MGKSILLCLLATFHATGQTPQETTTSVPTATQWLYDAVAPGAKGTIDSIVRLRCTKTNAVGSGFILDSGYVITNHHVVQGCMAADLEVVTSLAQQVPMEDLWLDDNRDLAAVKPKSPTRGTFEIEPARKVIVGTQLSAWGYPFAQPSPAPLLTVGFLSGFYEFQAERTKVPVKRLVLNAAVNPGNSGGPLISPEGTIVGVIVAKRALVLPEGLASVLQALGSNKYGAQFHGTEGGKPVSYSESQLTAALLDYYRQVSQVYIGEAIAASELTGFLDEKKIPWNQPHQTRVRSAKPAPKGKEQTSQPQER